LSRIDSAVDPALDKLAIQGGGPAELARKLQGEVAIASAVTAYQTYRTFFESERFTTLAQHGALPQRLLWASTSVKNPAYGDLKYVEALIGPNTINTVPVETLEAYRDHGQPEARLEMREEHAGWIFENLGTAGINLVQIVRKLEEDGVTKFNKAFDALIAALKAKATRFRDANNQTEGEEYVKSN
jgi:transaldolase